MLRTPIASLLQRSGALVRPVALLLAAFLLLASARGVVPGACLTLREGAEREALRQGAACEVSGPQSCCASPKGTAPESDSPADRHAPGCALCHLAKALTEAPEYYHYPITYQTPGLPPVSWHGTAPAQPVCGISLGRAPPSFPA